MTKCIIAGCGKETHKNSEYCYGHYMKNWRYGTPTPVHKPRWEDLIGQRFGTLTVMKRVPGKWLCKCDCGATRKVSTGELKRTGDNNTCGIRSHHLSDESGYGAAHYRVNKKFGPASNYKCVDCGRRASQWSYQHDDVNEHYEEGHSRNPIAYSLDMSHYVPRCISCHKYFDLKQTNSTAEILDKIA